jgi:aryl-alcohol dehydrogenase-like predicted oxidoreductase
MKRPIITRREFVKLSAAAAAGMAIAPGLSFGLDQLPSPMTRTFGKTGFDVTTLGLGGQASLQWTPDDVDPVAIILKAFGMKINYFDTSNLYDKSQLHFGEAFRQLKLIPGQTGYDSELRESIFLTTKTGIRWAKPGFPARKNVANWSQGDHGEGSVGDLKRSLSQMFGDGKGNYPEGSYVNMVLMHTLHNNDEVDILYQGLDTPLNKEENFGSLVAMRDFRDGTNLTGLNPGNERLIRHIGFSGHLNSPAMMEMIQRDSFDLLDGMLIAINPNDKRYLNHQYNVIPVAEARNMGIIGMKVFADGTMYGKEPRFSNSPRDVIRSVGTRELPSKPLVEYALTTPGIHTAIIGIGQISDDHLKCQLVQNYYAAQIAPDGLSDKKRLKLEDKTGQVNGGKTNYFQAERLDLSPPNNIRIQGTSDIEITWDTAYASEFPLSHYEILKEGEPIARIQHLPQTTKEPFRYLTGSQGGSYQVVTVDQAGNRAKSELITA